MICIGKGDFVYILILINRIDMKVTSFSISQKLAEIGFDKKAGFLDCYYNTEGQLRNKHQEKYYEEENTDVDCFSYDLETILDALPKEIENKIHPIESWQLDMTKEFIGYSYYYSCQSDVDKETLFSTIKLHTESLADMAARLLIKLHETGLVKFKED